MSFCVTKHLPSSDAIELLSGSLSTDKYGKELLVQAIEDYHVKDGVVSTDDVSIVVHLIYRQLLDQMMTINTSDLQIPMEYQEIIEKLSSVKKDDDTDVRLFIFLNKLHQFNDYSILDPPITVRHNISNISRFLQYFNFYFKKSWGHNSSDCLVYNSQFPIIQL